MIETRFLINKHLSSLIFFCQSKNSNIHMIYRLNTKNQSMKLTLIVLALVLTCLTTSSKFRLTKDYILSHKWRFNCASENRPDFKAALLADGTIQNMVNHARVPDLTWEFNQTGQWIKIQDSYWNMIYDFSTMIFSKSLNGSPELVIVGIQVFDPLRSANLHFNYLREYHEDNPIYKITKQLLTSVPWVFSAGAKDGIHETVVFRNDGKVYQGTNTSLKQPTTLYTFNQEYSLVEIGVGPYGNRQRFALNTPLANQNPFVSRCLTLAGGQQRSQRQIHKGNLKAVFLTQANAQRFIITKQMLLSKTWTLNFGSNNGLHQDVILNRNGKIYKKNNKTEVTSLSHWEFDEDKQWVYLQMHPNSQDKWNCTLSTVFVNDNPDLYPDVTLMGEYFGLIASGKGRQEYSICSLSLSDQESHETYDTFLQSQ